MAYIFGGAWMRRMWANNCMVTHITIQNKISSIMVIVKMVNGEGLKRIAFISGKDVVSCCRKLRAANRKGEVGWRVDKPYEPQVDENEP